MTRRLFGTDGVRGLANQDPMTPELAFRLGAAITYQARLQTQALGRHTPKVVIGRDTRLSGPMLEAALSAGVCALGGKAWLVGVLPTPAVAYLTTSLRADAGVMISASHNPFEDNGIKIFARDGFKLPDEAENELEALIDDKRLDTERPVGAKVGTFDRLVDASGRYITFAKQTFPTQLTLEGLKIVVDAAHGAAFEVAERVFEELGAEVITVATEPNGTNINDDCGALHPKTAARLVLEHKADIGIALDGDADRLIVIDECGQEVDGDVVMALCALHMLREGTLKNNTLVATVMSNLGLEQALKRANGVLVRTGVGDRYVVEEMRRSGCNVGGEQSGHMVFLDHATTGDGIVAALQLLKVLRTSNRPLSDLTREAMVRVPQTLLNVQLKARKPLSELPLTSAAILDAERKLNGEGRVLVRWSGTEAKLRIMVEGPDHQEIVDFAEAIAAEARKEITG